MRRLAALLTLLTLAVLPAACAPVGQFGEEPSSLDSTEFVLPVPDDAWSGEVTRVVDGDTLWVEVTDPAGTNLRIGEERKLRLLRIDTPEVGRDGDLSECLADEATTVLGNLAPRGSVVQLAYDTERQDRFDRDLVHVWNRDGTWVNGAMLSGGYANVVTFPPNVAHTDEVQLAERYARENLLGLWAPDACA